MMCAAAARDHRLKGIATAEKGALEIDIDHAVPVGFVHLQRRLDEVDAGVVDQRVDLSVGRQGFVYESFAVCGLGDVRLEEQALAEAPLQVSRDLRAQPLVDVGDDHFGAGFGKALGDAGADAAGRAGDDSDMSLPIHG